jgi:hypothetical protein
MLAGLCLAADAGAAAPRMRRQAMRGQPYANLIPASIRKVEGVQMLLAILNGEPIGPGHGWFHPSQSLYHWKWLAGRMDADGDGVITRKEFTGPAALFDRLDRDGDGRLTPADLDWSGTSPLVQQARLAEQLFRRADTNSDGRISAKEWQALFQKATAGKGEMTPEDLRKLLFPPAPPRRPMRGGGPPRALLLAGLFSGEIGSLGEGPRLGARAPDFTLSRHDGKGTVSLSSFRGKKPVVLIFGSFT